MFSLLGGDVEVATEIVSVGGRDGRECCALLHNIALLVDNVYRWYWQLDLVASYTISDAYDQFLTYIDQHVHSYLPDFIWHKEAP